MESWVGLTLGTGGEGACITSRMFLGGWLYPDTPSVAIAAAEVTPNEKDALDCAAICAAQATSAPTKRKCKAFRTGISFLRCNSPAKTDRQDNASCGLVIDHWPKILRGGNRQVNEGRGVVVNACSRTVTSTTRRCSCASDTFSVSKLVHEGEIARHYISLIALLAHPALSGVTIPEHPSVDMLVAQLAVLVAPARRNQPSPRANRQALVGRGIVSTLPPTFSCWFQFRPYPDLAIAYDGYILSFVIFGDSVRSLKLLSFPSPVWVKHHPDIESLPVGTEISQLQSDYSWFFFFLTSQNRGPRFFIEGLQHGAEVSALAEQKPKPSRARALDDVVETAWKDVETALKLERGISGLRGRAATHLGDDKLREIFERLSSMDFHFLPASQMYSSPANGILGTIYGVTKLPPSSTGARSTQQFCASSRTNVSRSSRMRRLPEYRCQRSRAMRRACSAMGSVAIFTTVRCGM